MLKPVISFYAVSATCALGVGVRVSRSNEPFINTFVLQVQVS